MGKLLACRTNEIQRKKTNVTTPLLLNLLGDQNPDRAVWVTSTFLRPGLLPGPPHWPRARSPPPPANWGSVYHAKREMVMVSFTEWSEFLGCFNIN